MTTVVFSFVERIVYLVDAVQWPSFFTISDHAILDNLLNELSKKTFGKLAVMFHTKSHAWRGYNIRVACIGNKEQNQTGKGKSRKSFFFVPITILPTEVVHSLYKKYWHNWTNTKQKLCRPS